MSDFSEGRGRLYRPVDHHDSSAGDGESVTENINDSEINSKIKAALEETLTTKKITEKFIENLDTLIQARTEQVEREKRKVGPKLSPQALGNYETERDNLVLKKQRAVEILKLKPKGIISRARNFLTRNK